MEVKTKYNNGEKVWFLYWDKVRNIEVKDVSFTSLSNGFKSVSYSFQHEDVE